MNDNFVSLVFYLLLPFILLGILIFVGLFSLIWIPTLSFINLFALHLLLDGDKKMATILNYPLLILETIFFIFIVNTVITFLQRLKLQGWSCPKTLSSDSNPKTEVEN